MDECQHMSDTLLIRHLPGVLSLEDQEDLIKHFGASDVKCIGNKGPLKHAAFAKFPNSNIAQQALKRLHQLPVLNCVLKVEYAKKDFSEIQENRTVDSVKSTLKSISGETNTDSVKKVNEIAAEPDVQKVQNEIDIISQRWNVRYAFNNKLRYSYPPPSVSILTNIANTLASVPKFYVQVLHLMNKMNLPAPFGMVTATPPIPSEPPPLPREDIPLPPSTLPGEEAMDMSSTEESELESDEEEDKQKTNTLSAPVPTNILKRKSTEQKKVSRKKMKLQTQVIKLQTQMAASVPKTQPQAKPEEVFEQSNNMAKKSSFKFGPLLGSSSSSNVSASESGTVLHFETNSEHQVSADDTLNDKEPSVATDGTEKGELGVNDQLLVVEEGGFGKIEPVLNTRSESESGEEEEEWGAGEFISSRKLRHGRLSSREMKDYNVFKNYQPGEANTRLYVKNLTKQTTEKDLHYIFGKYVNWEKDTEKNMFDIRLMKEGRMKGQCFITLGNTRRAEDALKDTNAFMLNGKPMVVQFARSAKPKEVQENQTTK